LYAGQLTGFPFVIGAANVYRVPAQGGTPESLRSGFTNIIDLAFDASGTLYVLQIGNGLGAPLAPPGRRIRVNANGSQTVIYDQLFFPGGLAIGPDGAAYVTNFGIVPGPVAGFVPGSAARSCASRSTDWSEEHVRMSYVA
jgi:DNA-binding beta-propeller fold protein YncE